MDCVHRPPRASRSHRRTIQSFPSNFFRASVQSAVQFRNLRPVTRVTRLHLRIVAASTPRTVLAPTGGKNGIQRKRITADWQSTYWMTGTGTCRMSSCRNAIRSNGAEQQRASHLLFLVYDCMTLRLPAAPRCSKVRLHLTAIQTERAESQDKLANIDGTSDQKSLSFLLLRSHDGKYACIGQMAVLAHELSLRPSLRSQGPPRSSLRTPVQAPFLGFRTGIWHG